MKFKQAAIFCPLLNTTFNAILAAIHNISLYVYKPLHYSRIQIVLWSLDCIDATPLNFKNLSLKAWLHNVHTRTYAASCAHTLTQISHIDEIILNVWSNDRATSSVPLVKIRIKYGIQLPASQIARLIFWIWNCLRRFTTNVTNSLHHPTWTFVYLLYSLRVRLHRLFTLIYHLSSVSLCAYVWRAVTVRTRSTYDLSSSILFNIHSLYFCAHLFSEMWLFRPFFLRPLHFVSLFSKELQWTLIKSAAKSNLVSIFSAQNTSTNKMLNKHLMIASVGVFRLFLSHKWFYERMEHVSLFWFQQ